MRYRLTPRLEVRTRFRFYRWARHLAAALSAFAFILFVLRPFNALALWLPIILQAVISSRWEYWRCERLAIHSLIVGHHRGKHGRALRL